MNSLNALSAKCDLYTPVLARFFIASLFIYAGIGKLLSFAQTAELMGVVGVPMPEVALGIGILLEISGALSLLLGFKPKWGTLALVFFTVVTIGLFHSKLTDPNQLISALKNLAIIAGLMMFYVHGPGIWTIDAILAKRKAGLPTTPAPSSIQPTQ